LNTIDGNVAAPLQEDLEMAEGLSELIARLRLAFRAFWRILTDPPFARDAAELLSSADSPRTGDPGGGARLRAVDPTSALQLLGLLQRDGRLIDFLEQDVAQYSDGEIGAAVRVVHEGCRKVLGERFRIEPVFEQAEGSRVTLEAGFDAASVQPTGELFGEPPFAGILVHRGWRATDVRLPKLAAGHDSRVLAPAEVEL
jgi:hypothetical protein